jgi:hypothetical protein
MPLSGLTRYTVTQFVSTHANPTKCQTAGPTLNAVHVIQHGPHLGRDRATNHFPRVPAPALSLPTPFGTKGGKAFLTFLEVIKAFFELLEKTFHPE